MYSAIIAEDSKPIMRNIQALLQSTDLPIRITATVSNGIEALEFLENNTVDILLTDIRMPKLDGLALIEQSKRMNPRLKAVLISGYNDFEYTRKALNLQVFDYLLKPVERLQLVEVMERLVKQLNEEHRNAKVLLEGMVEPEFLAAIELGMEFYNSGKILILARRQPFTCQPGIDRITHVMLQDCLSKAWGPHSCWVFPAIRPEQFIILVNLSILDIYPSVNDCAKSVREMLMSHGIKICIAADPQPARDKELVDGYKKLDKIVNEQISVSGGLIITEYSIPRSVLSNAEMDKLILQFTDMISQRQKERFTILLKQLLVNFHSSNIRIAELERFIWSMEEFLSNMASGQPGERQKVDREIRQLLRSESYEAFTEALLSRTETNLELLMHQNKKSSEELFRQLDHYLQQNIYSQLSITDVALKFHVSPSYISRIFRKHSQTTFVYYFMQLKINEACRLIANKPELKVKDVSEVLSFSDQHYFSKVFKEYTGCTPTEYKEGRRQF